MEHFSLESERIIWQNGIFTWLMFGTTVSSLAFCDELSDPKPEHSGLMYRAGDGKPYFRRMFDPKPHRVLADACPKYLHPWSARFIWHQRHFGEIVAMFPNRQRIDGAVLETTSPRPKDKGQLQTDHERSEYIRNTNNNSFRCIWECDVLSRVRPNAFMSELVQCVFGISRLGWHRVSTLTTHCLAELD